MRVFIVKNTYKYKEREKNPGIFSNIPDKKSNNPDIPKLVLDKVISRSQIFNNRIKITLKS